MAEDDYNESLDLGKELQREAKLRKVMEKQERIKQKRAEDWDDEDE